MRYSHLRRFYTPRKAVIAAAVAAFMVVAYIGYHVLALDVSKATRQLVEVYDRNGQLISSTGGTTGKYITYEQIPETLKQAILATEDRRFFQHGGFDLAGIGRAAVANVKAGAVVQGGSTITQQLAKNLYLSNERTLIRKFREFLYAIGLELHLSKEKIFELYVNKAYLGSGNYGIDAAARSYFNKPVGELKLYEAAVIAGLFKAPSRYSPIANDGSARQRAEQVIANMQEAEYLSAEQAQQAITQLAAVKDVERNAAHESLGYFTDWVKQQLQETIEWEGEPLKVYTTLDVNQQYQAYQAVHRILAANGKSHKASQAALLTLDNHGAITAMIGGADYRSSPFNRAAIAKRQPGSSFKTLVYLNALQQGADPNQWVNDRPVDINGYKPENYGRSHQGHMLLREALLKSVNTVAVQLGQEYNMSNVVQLARKLGVKSPLEPYPSLALGTAEMSVMEMATIYAHLAAEGKQVKPYAITKITDFEDQTLYEYAPVQNPPQLVDQKVIRQMNGLLMDVVNAGTGRAAAIGRPAAGKTGTSQNFRDAVFIGYTPQYTTAVWVGNDDNTPMRGVTGGSLPAQIWARHMSGIHKGLQVAYLKSNLNSLADARDKAYQTLPWLENEAESTTSNAPGSTLPWLQGKRGPSTDIAMR